MTPLSKLDNLLSQFEKAINSMRAALAQHKDEFVRDSAIKRFEFTFELAWKTMKAFLEEQGIRRESPRACFKEAFSQGIIEYEEIWLEILKLRNQTAHIYNENLAEEIYSRLPEVLIRFENLPGKIKEHS